MEYKLEDLINISLLQDLQDKLNVIYSFPSAIIDVDGKILTAVAWQDICTKFHRTHPECEKECIKSDQYILSHLNEANPAVSYQCPHGLIDNATPIIIEGNHLGNFFTGQFFLEQPDLEFFKKQAAKYGFDEEAYLEAVKKVPIWTKEKLYNYLDFIKGFIEIIASIGLNNLKERQINEALKEKDDRNHAILKTAMDGFWLVNRKGDLIEVNDTYCRLSGYGKEELLSMNVSDIDANETEDENTTHIRKIISQGEDRFVTKHRRKDGSLFDVEISVQYQPHNNGMFVVFLRDVTEKKRIDEDLLLAKLKAEESEEKFSRAFEYAAFAIALVGPQRQFISVNPSFCRMIGYPRDELLQKTFSDITYPDDIKIGNELVSELIQGKRDYFWLEKRYVHKNGQIVWGLLSTSMVRDSNNSPLLMVAQIQDITERKLAEKELLESAQRLKLATASGKLGIWDWNIKDNKMVWDDQMFELYGINHDAFTSNIEVWKERLHPDDRQKAIDEYNAALRGEKDFNTTFRILRPDGKVLFINADGLVIRDNKGAPIRMIGINNDITENKLAEEALIKAKDQIEESDRKYRMIFESSGTANAIFDKEYRLVLHNSISKEQLKAKGDEYIGKSVFDIFGPKTGKEIEERMKRIFSNGVSETFETQFFLPAGEKWFRSSYQPVFDDDDKMVALQVISQDITEIKKAEHDLIIAKEKAEESDRLKTAFLQNMSHEIRTPMNAIIGFSELLVKNYNNKTKLEHFSDIINHRCNDLLDIINDILDISKIESGQIPINPEMCNIHSLLNELKMFFNEYSARVNKQHISLKINLGIELTDISITTDKVKLKQIFINLINNAFKFTENGEIEVGCNIDSNRDLYFYVFDTGIGIPKNKQQLIFDRFYQVDKGSSRLYGGTGLGLSIVKGLVDMLGGRVWLESEPGKGSKFFFTVKHEIQGKSKLTNEDECVIPKDQHFHNKTVLVVEDDTYNNLLFNEILPETGLKILYTENGQDAIDTAITHKPDLVLLDIGLPDISGYEVAHQILQKLPTIKIIAQTAYASETDKQMAINSGCVDHISKPIKVQELLAVINKWL